MDISGLTTVAADNKASAAADALTSSAGKLSSASSDDELLDTVKDFESYFLEQIIKEVKDTFTMEDDSTSSSMSKYKDYFMDTAISPCLFQFRVPLNVRLFQCKFRII